MGVAISLILLIAVIAFALDLRNDPVKNAEKSLIQALWDKEDKEREEYGTEQ